MNNDAAFNKAKIIIQKIHWNIYIMKYRLYVKQGYILLLSQQSDHD